MKPVQYLQDTDKVDVCNRCIWVEEGGGGVTVLLSAHYTYQSNNSLIVRVNVSSSEENAVFQGAGEIIRLG